jgi:hypothetical protein
VFFEQVDRAQNKRTIDRKPKQDGDGRGPTVAELQKEIIVLKQNLLENQQETRDTLAEMKRELDELKGRLEA